MEPIIPYIFHEGAIPATYVMQCIERYGSVTTIGAYSSFIGQVRADRVDDREVAAIEYTAYPAMVTEKMQVIAETIWQQYSLMGLEVKHSLGTVAAGEICLFVLAAAGHRRAAMEACQELVERIKNELPIWGKERFVNEGYQWKTNQ